MIDGLSTALRLERKRSMLANSYLLAGIGTNRSFLRDPMAPFATTPNARQVRTVHLG